MIGKGPQRIIDVDLLVAIAGALARSGNAPNILYRVRALYGEDMPSTPVHSQPTMGAANDD